MDTTSKSPFKKKKEDKSPIVLSPPPSLPRLTIIRFPLFLPPSRSIAKKRNQSWQINPRHRSVMHSISWNRSDGRSRAGPSRAEKSRVPGSRARLCGKLDGCIMYLLLYLLSWGITFASVMTFSHRAILGMQ